MSLTQQPASGLFCSGHTAVVRGTRAAAVTRIADINVPLWIPHRTALQPLGIAPPSHNTGRHRLIQCDVPPPPTSVERPAVQPPLLLFTLAIRHDAFGDSRPAVVGLLATHFGLRPEHEACRVACARSGCKPLVPIGSVRSRRAPVPYGRYRQYRRTTFLQPVDASVQVLEPGGSPGPRSTTAAPCRCAKPDYSTGTRAVAACSVAPDVSRYL